MMIPVSVVTSEQSHSVISRHGRALFSTKVSQERSALSQRHVKNALLPKQKVRGMGELVAGPVPESAEHLCLRPDQLDVHE